VTTPHPAIVEVLNRLKNLSSIPIIQNGDTISIEPINSNGFKCELVDSGLNYMVFFDGWHTDQFNSFEDAAKCFLFGLTTAARLCVKERGNWRYWWNLETYADGEWGGIEITGIPFWPFWRRKKTFYLQNDWIQVEKLKPWIGEQFSGCKIVQ